MATTNVEKYKKLGDVLLQALGNERSQSWLAECTFVTQEAVSQWLAGYSRPRPERLGQVAALLNLIPEEVIELAKYDDDPTARHNVLTAYKQWCLIYRVEVKEPSRSITAASTGMREDCDEHTA